MVAEREATPSTTRTTGSRPVTGQPAPDRLSSLVTDTVDVAVIGADVAGLAAALAVARAQPGARVMLYDTASGPPVARDGGALLSVNGQRALQALDSDLYRRVISELGSSVQESLWFDLEGELVRRTPLGQPSTVTGTSTSNGVTSRRRASLRRRPAPVASPRASGPFGPDPAAPPFVVGLHELRDALAEALPPEVQIFGRHHVRAVEPSPGGGSVIHFAASPGGSPVRSIRAKLLVGADGPSSVVRKLQFDTATDPGLQLSGRTVWRGRFTLRKRDPDFARLRNFTTATRSWVDLRAAPGAERQASLSPAGPNTFVWMASCPTSLLASRGLKETAAEGGASSYWRCLAMFEDFPQEFFAVLRATADNAVAEFAPPALPSAAAAAGLAAPWQWSSGCAALVGEAIVGLPADDASSTALNLALEDAAVLGACVAQYGMSARALQEYARQRGPRVSSLLALPPSAPERVRLRDAPFLPAALPAVPEVGKPAIREETERQELAAEAVLGTNEVSLKELATAAVDAAAAAAVTPAAAQPLEEVLSKAAAAAAAAAASRQSVESAAAVPQYTSPDGLARPSGGASRALHAPMLPTEASLGAPSSLLFSRPSGVRRLGPLVPAALAGLASLVTMRAGPAGPSPVVVVTEGESASAPAAGAVPAAGLSSSAPSASSHPPAAVEPVEAATSTSAPVAAALPPRSAVGTAAEEIPSTATAVLAPATYTAELTPCSVWEALLRSEQTASDLGSGGSADSQASALLRRQPREYCVLETPVAVWQALLVEPHTAHGMLLARPYDAAESPSLVWMALLGAHAPAAAAVMAASSAASLAAAPSHPAPCSASTDAAADTSTSQAEVGALLPKPVMKQKPQGTTTTQPSEASSAPSTSAVAPASLDGPGHPASPLPQAPLVQAASAVPPPSPGGGNSRHQRLDRRSSRGSPGTGHGQSQAIAAGGAKAHADRPSRAGKTGAAAGPGSPGQKPTRRSAPPPGSRARAAAKAAAKMTVSLSAAAALGGVISAGGGHMPVDMASALHVHGAVSQFWDELNSLTMSSMSSIDLS